MASSNDVRKKISQLHQELVNAYKKRFMFENGQVTVVECSPVWKNTRKCGTRKVRPQRVAARSQKELLCAMAFQELKWHAVDGVDFDDAEADILEIVHESGTSVLDVLEPVWTCFAF